MAAGSAGAATCFWNGNGNGNGARFGTKGNWLCNGSVPAAAPGASDDVYFDASSGTNKDCTFNVAVSVNSITFKNGYTATGSGGTSSIAAGSWTMSTGAFAAGAGAITVTGNLSISGSGSFTASSTTTQITRSFTNSGTFSANGDSVTLVGSSSGGTITSGGSSFNNLTINASGGTDTLNDDLTLTGTGLALNAGYPYTPAGGAGDAITAAPLYYNGVLVVGSTGGKLYFLDRNNGDGASLINQYNFGSNQSVSGIGFDVNVNRSMVTTASSSRNDGRLYYFDLVADPTNGAL